MRKHYDPPQLTEYGDIADLTAIFGSSEAGDVLVNPAGNVVQTGTGSLDACPTRDFDICDVDP